MGYRKPVDRGRRAAAAAAALAACAVALLPPLESAAHRTVSAHMTQHLLLGMAAPLLLALAGPVSFALRSAGPAGRRRLRAVLHSRVLRLLGHPMVGWALFVGTPFAVYFTPLYAASLRSAWVHAGVHLLFLTGGLAFFWPLVAVDPVPGRPSYAARLLSAFLALPFHAFMGIALMSSARPLAPGVRLSDQQAAGGLLWAVGDLIALAMVGTVAAQWLRADRVVAAREDRATASPGPPAGSRPAG